MKKFSNFFKTSLLGGTIVILPVVILIIFFTWLFRLVTGLIRPLTNVLSNYFELHPLFVDGLAIVLIISTCFFVGVFIKTRFGKFVHHTVEQKILGVAPGYNMVKETVLQILGGGGKRTAFSTVVLAKLFDSQTMATGFLMDENENGIMTVFIPTAPNPTTGFIFHIPAKDVQIIDINVDVTMRSILGCGTGASKLIDNYFKKINNL